MYLLKLALRPWRLATLSQAFAGFAVGVLLVMTGFLHWMQSGLKPVLSRLQGEQVLTAYLDPSLDPKDEAGVVDAIRGTLGAHPSIELGVVKPAQFLTHVKGAFPELARELEDLGPEANSIVPSYVSISGILPDSALSQIRQVKGVESAESSKDRYQHIVGAFRALRWISRLLALGLLIALLTGLIHLSRMNSYLHRDSLSLLRQWGAGEWTLRTPAMISGLSVGALGGVIAGASWMAVGLSLGRQIRGLSPLLREMPVSTLSTATMAGVLLLAGLGLGVLAGVLGSGSGGATGNTSVAGAAGREA